MGCSFRGFVCLTLTVNSLPVLCCAGPPSLQRSDVLDQLANPYRVGNCCQEWSTVGYCCQKWSTVWALLPRLVNCLGHCGQEWSMQLQLLHLSPCPMQLQLLHLTLVLSHGRIAEQRARPTHHRSLRAASPCNAHCRTCSRSRLRLQTMPAACPSRKCRPGNGASSPRNHCRAECGTTPCRGHSRSLLWVPRTMGKDCVGTAVGAIRSHNAACASPWSRRLS